MLSARFILVGVVLLTGAGCGGDDSPTGAESPPPLVATLGDSITAGAPRWSPNPKLRKILVRGPATRESQWQYGAERALDGRFRFRNCGVEGDRTDEIELRLEACAADAQILVVQGGTNDIVQGRTPSSAAANIRQMVRRARDAGLDVLVTTVPPLNARHPRWAPEIRRLNELIHALAREEDVSVIDFFKLLEDPRRPGRMRADWTADGVHPTVEGYRRIGRVAARRLGQL
jgi:lysophospholipase L1-like esterase